MKLFFNYLLVPSLDIKGAAIATVLAFMIITLLNIALLMKKKLIMIEWKPLVMTLFSVGIMYVVIKFYHTGFEWIYPFSQRWTETMKAMSSVFIGGTVYIVLVFRTNVYSEKEKENLPVIKKWRTKKDRGYKG
ncbi:polysaccharide biosynthesis C-terminal domain-containing protein [Bacillus carboniphilus]|uniref:Polysaccharide biosynthesis C-terminal domain-containing protein n=1 Tax=Bacillus carboniphilus TaxID=86663 RepID=A0ABY9JRA1_9BACI|nr:polysaccharide biosynthesis C-terminal domain-containing protein [Bacillus carboniphilus]WLR41932.1 polysaccharide biosynthesis C-terminal domain-containing protein [Bacillus carboniphilus]